MKVSIIILMALPIILVLNKKIYNSNIFLQKQPPWAVFFTFFFGVLKRPLNVPARKRVLKIFLNNNEKFKNKSTTTKIPRPCQGVPFQKNSVFPDGYFLPYTEKIKKRFPSKLRETWKNVLHFCVK